MYTTYYFITQYHALPIKTYKKAKKTYSIADNYARSYSISIEEACKILGLDLTRDFAKGSSGAPGSKPLDPNYMLGL